MFKKTNDFKRNMQAKNMDAYIIFNNDPHLNEYLPDHWKIIPYLSGFTGSAGTIVFTHNIVGLWTDSRYFIQAENELKNAGIQLFREGEKSTQSISEFLISSLQVNSVVGINYITCSIEEYKNLKEDLSQKDISLQDIDLTHKIRQQLPPLPASKIFHHAIEYSGEEHKSKYMKIRNLMEKNLVKCLIIGTLDDVAWTLNLRGSDIPCNPVFYSYLILTLDTITLYIDKDKIPDNLLPYFHENKIELKDYNTFFKELINLKNCRIWLDPSTTNKKIVTTLGNNNIVLKENPVQKLKSQKNNVEIQGMRKAMLEDSVALTKFWSWLEENFQKKVFTEYEIILKLKELRSQQNGYLYDSFDAIVGFKGNGAIVHYKPDESHSLNINTEGVLLVDSGGQYKFGTTDITRTFWLGENPPYEVRRDYTLVLKGLISLSQAIFPEGTYGCNLDILARKTMWENGINYGHGTGHGVGTFLNVHEGPQNIRRELNQQTILEGMITSNEPGIYRTGEYGIRLENLILCKKHKSTNFGNFLCFETLPFFPFEKRLIDIELLNNLEIKWLNNYHKEVFSKLSPLLSSELVKWLAEIGRASCRERVCMFV